MKTAKKIATRKSEPLHLRLETIDLRKLARLAYKEHRTTSGMARFLIEEGLERRA